MGYVRIYLIMILGNSVSYLIKEDYKPPLEGAGHVASRLLFFIYMCVLLIRKRRP